MACTFQHTVLSSSLPVRLRALQLDANVGILLAPPSACRTAPVLPSTRPASVRPIGAQPAPHR
jgi:hypothetical protein